MPSFGWMAVQCRTPGSTSSTAPPPSAAAPAITPAISSWKRRGRSDGRSRAPRPRRARAPRSARSPPPARSRTAREQRARDAVADRLDGAADAVGDHRHARPPAPRRARSRSPPRRGTAARGRRAAARRARRRRPCRGTRCRAPWRAARTAVHRAPVTRDLQRAAQPRAGRDREVDALVGDDAAERQVVVARVRAPGRGSARRGPAGARSRSRGRSSAGCARPRGPSWPRTRPARRRRRGPGGAAARAAAAAAGASRARLPRPRGSPPPRRSASACGSSRRAACPGGVRTFLAHAWLLESTRSKPRQVERAEGAVHQRQQLRVVAPRARQAVQQRGVDRAFGDLGRPRRRVVDRREQLRLREHLEQLEHDLLGAARDRQPVVDDRDAPEALAQLLQPRAGAGLGAACTGPRLHAPAPGIMAPMSLPPALQGRDIVCVGFADWDTDLWTNQHHLMSRLARGNRVLFVESLGLRRPQLAGRDLRRIARRLRTGLQPPREPRRAARALAPGAAAARQRRRGGA